MEPADELEKLLRLGWRVDLSYSIPDEKFKGRVYHLNDWRDVTTLSADPIEALDTAIEMAVRKQGELREHTI